MDNGPLWSKDDAGRYWLVFPNKHALTKDEIKDIFSEFGTVVNIQTAGDEKGFRFVNYATQEDAEKAVDSLKNHPLIKLIPYRPKSKKGQNSSNVSKDGQNNNIVAKSPSIDNNNDNLRKNFYQRKPLPSKSFACNNETSSQTQQPACNITSNTSNFDTVSFYKEKNFDHTLNQDKFSSCSSNASGSKDNLVDQNVLNKHQMSPTRSIEITSPSNSINHAEKVHTLLKLRGINANTFTSAQVSSVNSNKSSSSICEDEIPDLVTKSKIVSNKQLKKMIFNAEEVIVANIHTDYGSAYILHLLDEFEPLAISYIKVLPKSEVRYCHVYFKSIQDSIGVETQFDKYNLAGKKLVVLRPCRVMEEGINED